MRNKLLFGALLLSLSFTKCFAQMSGGIAPTPIGNCAGCAAPAASVGSSTSGGHTTTSASVTFPAITIAGGFSSSTVAAVDAVSGNAPVGAFCQALVPTTYIMTYFAVCAITATGVATIYMRPWSGLAIGSTTLTGIYISWVW